jgi:hypothetical protein
VKDLAARLSKPNDTSKDSDATFPEAAVSHGELRYSQGYALHCWCMNLEFYR